MGVMTPALLDTEQAFDGVAAGYGRSNAGNPLLCAMRQRLRDRVGALVAPGARLLDLGCGPGADAVAFAAHGYHVTAVDSSLAMAEAALRASSEGGVADRVDVHHLGIHELARLGERARPFAAAYSNFGPLNCIVDLPAAATLIAERLQPGGVLIASVIGRVCPWEIALYASRGRLSRAALRFRRGLVPVPLEGRTVWTRYFSPREFASIFAAAGMTRLSLRGLGLFVPPPYMQAFAERHPRMIARLQRAEDRWGARPALRGWGDHFLIVLRKA